MVNEKNNKIRRKVEKLLDPNGSRKMPLPGLQIYLWPHPSCCNTMGIKPQYVPARYS